MSLGVSGRRSRVSRCVRSEEPCLSVCQVGGAVSLVVSGRRSRVSLQPGVDQTTSCDESHRLSGVPIVSSAAATAGSDS